MTFQKIAITVPPPFLKRLDKWVRKAGKSRSRFIVDEMDKRLKDLEDAEITRLYSEAWSDTEAAAADRDLAEEMLNVSAVSEEGEEW